MYTDRIAELLKTIEGLGAGKARRRESMAKAGKITRGGRGVYQLAPAKE
jgi:hypothetical protein